MPVLCLVACGAFTTRRFAPCNGGRWWRPPQPLRLPRQQRRGEVGVDAESSRAPPRRGWLRPRVRDAGGWRSIAAPSHARDAGRFRLVALNVATG
jgi:hypothetical protein